MTNILFGKANLIGGILFLVLYLLAAAFFHLSGDEALMVIFTLVHAPVTSLFIKMDPWFGSLSETSVYVLFLITCGALWFLAGWILGFIPRILGALFGKKPV